MNTVVTNGVYINGNQVVVNGKELPLVPSSGNNITVTNGKVYIDGYEYKRGKWRRTLNALWHLWFEQIGGLEFPGEEVSDLYKGLWIIYFNKHPKLLEYAASFDEFNDMFRGKSVNCQADVVSAMVKDRDAFVKTVKNGHWYKTMVSCLLKKGG